ncbi:MAG: Rieske (2Fe-2S) protein [Lysobacter sp.]|nr:Rieske (2Fe-2S) protein [Lysobacter sp.]
MRTSLNPGAGPDGGAAPPLARLDALPDGGLATLEARVDGEDEPLIVLRRGDSVRAWLNVCPHAGRRLDWAPGEFLRAKNGDLVCAVHGATFELDAGTCVAGPCRGDRLRAVPVEVRDGCVWLAPDDAPAVA